MLADPVLSNYSAEPTLGKSSPGCVRGHVSVVATDGFEEGSYGSASDDFSGVPGDGDREVSFP